MLGYRIEWIEQQLAHAGEGCPRQGLQSHRTPAAKKRNDAGLGGLPGQSGIGAELHVDIRDLPACYKAAAVV